MLTFAMIAGHSSVFVTPSGARLDPCLALRRTSREALLHRSQRLTRSCFALVHKSENQLLCFHARARSLVKTPGGGGVSVDKKLKSALEHAGRAGLWRPSCSGNQGRCE